MEVRSATRVDRRRRAVGWGFKHVSTTMVELEEVQDSNAQITERFPPGMVAVFAGATRGIGKATMLEFAKHMRQPRIYLLARSEDTAQPVLDELHEVNPDGEYYYVEADLSLINMVDAACRRVRENEKAINVLFMSQGTLDFTSRTKEGLRTMWALSYFSRMRLISNLLDHLRRGESLRRVVCVMAGSREGPIDPNDVSGRKVPIRQARGHLSSCITFGLEHFAEMAPEVSFIHDHPGSVPTKPTRALPPGMASFAVSLSMASGRKISLEESAERHLFLTTSSRYPPISVEDRPLARGVPLSAGLRVALSSTARVAGGVYTVNSDCVSADYNTLELLRTMREQNIPAALWEWTQEEIDRVEVIIPDPPTPKEQPKPLAMEPEEMLFLPRPMPDGTYPLPDPVSATRPPVTTPEPPEPLDQPAPELVQDQAAMFLPQVRPDGTYPLPDRVRPTRLTTPEPPEPLAQPHPEMLPNAHAMFLPEVLPDGTYPLPAKVRPTRLPIPSPEPEPEPKPEPKPEPAPERSATSESHEAARASQDESRRRSFLPMFVKRLQPKPFRPFKKQGRTDGADDTSMAETVPERVSQSASEAVPETAAPGTSSHSVVPLSAPVLRPEVNEAQTAKAAEHAQPNTVVSHPATALNHASASGFEPSVNATQAAPQSPTAQDIIQSYQS